MPSAIGVPRAYCQYSAGPCDNSFDGVVSTDVYFFYSSRAPLVANAIEGGIARLQERKPDMRIQSWRDMPINGQLIFCEICKAQRFTKVAVIDVTTMNLNLMFELGYALGLGLPVIPIRDTTYSQDQTEFDALGLTDILGYVSFSNSEELAEKLSAAIASVKFPIATAYSPNHEQPVFLLRSPVVTNGLMRILSLLKKSGLKFRSFDPIEQPRLSLQEAFRQVKTSMGVCVYLLASNRKGATVHNARAAFVAGLSMASGIFTFALQEGFEQQPIDYRDVIQHYTDDAQIQHLITPFIKQIYEAVQSTRFVPITMPLGALETLDLGDVAAENEISALKSYFIPTAQYNDAKRGHARIVVGRKGAGKTATFYGIRNAFWSSASHIVLDLKPEGHQFLTLREQLLDSLSKGMQEHVLTALWHYLLLIELAAKIVDTDGRRANKSYERFALFDKLIQILGPEIDAEEGDFSERLLTLVNRLIERRDELDSMSSPGDVSRLIYERDIKELHETLNAYLKHRDGVWILVDNLDKSWPVNRASNEDILIIRSLMEATRKLQRQFARSSVECRAIVFIRNDVFEHLLNETPDKGKDIAVVLDWTDEEMFKLLIHRRMVASTKLDLSFEEIWPMFFETYIRGEHSFSYILSRTMMRPRDLISFLRQCINVAVNRGNTKVLEQDILQAEKQYSEDQLQAVFDELRDINSDFACVPYAFINSRSHITEQDLIDRFNDADIKPDAMEEVKRILLWFGFLGVLGSDGEEKYAHMYQYGVARLLRDASATTTFVVHPAFRSVLLCDR